jgi:exopolysaccharide biosynthesis operon protein EpsL
MLKISKIRSLVFLSGSLLVATSVSAAPEDAFRPYVSYSVTRDDNLFRTASNAETETINQLMAGINVDLPISRQRVLARASVSKTKFSRFGDLDYSGRDLLGQWDWQLGNQWSGDLGYSNTRTLASFADFQQRTQNLRTQTNRFFDAAYKLHPEWQVKAGMSRHELTNSAESQSYVDSTSDTAQLALNYVSPTSSTVGLQVKRIDGKLPNRELIVATLYDNSYRQTEYNATADWAFSGDTRFTGRLGYTKRAHDQVPERDFSGIAGRLGMNWMLAGKTSVDFAVWRELGSVDSGVASYYVTKGASITPNWAVTSKLNLRGRLSTENRDYQGDPRAVNYDARQDKVRTLSVGASYTPWRNTQVGLNYQRDRRSSNRAGAEYSDNSITASIRIDF